MDDPTQPDAVTPPEPDGSHLPSSTAPATTLPSRPARGTPGPGTIVATALLSAVLASGGTVAVLSSTGALRPAAAPAAAPSSSLDGATTVRIDESSAVVDAAAKVSPAVVRITASGVTTDQLGGTIPAQGVGSGVIFDPAGWVLTNRHVVQIDSNTIASKLTVELKDGQQYTGTVYGTDTLTDLAVVKIEATGLTAAPIGASADIKVGQLAIAIGSPLGTYSNSVTSGIVSGTGRSVVVESGKRLSNLIQTDAAINPGNSGGPLLDAAGNVIGINTAIAQNSSGIGFAIPIDIARPVMRQALAGQPLARPYMGVRYEAIDPQVKAAEKLSVDRGALIISSPDATGATQPAIVPGGPAEKAGLKEGDIIVAVEGQAIDTEHPLDLVLSGYAPGQTIDLTILRGGTTSHVKITLGTRPES
ncbi:MAG TPA: trypsin-like peptidase domain-containing protein [Candidatus Limnocylindrales bacterium]